jgi:hypothetical protein
MLKNNKSSTIEHSLADLNFPLELSHTHTHTHTHQHTYIYLSSFSSTTSQKTSKIMNGFSNGSQSKQPHFVLVPLMAQGHLIPMIDMAHLLASHGALVTLITTPLNASRIETIIQHAKYSQLPLQFLPLPINCAEVGLPDGSENLDTLRNGLQEFSAFLEACFFNKDPLISYLRKHETPPSCLISDISQPWTGEVAREFGIPRLCFIGFSAFASLCRYGSISPFFCVAALHICNCESSILYILLVTNRCEKMELISLKPNINS